MIKYIQGLAPGFGCPMEKSAITLLRPDVKLNMPEFKGAHQ